MSKRILITGINQAQTQRDFYLRQQLQVVPSHYGLIRCLEDMGWEVDQRPVTIGEDLSGYDEVIVYIHNLQSFAARIWSGLWTISQRPDCILAFDDWQFKGMIDSIIKYKESIIEDNKPFRKYLFDHYGGPEGEDVIKAHAQDYIDGCTIVENRNNRLLVSAFAGGADVEDPNQAIFRFDTPVFLADGQSLEIKLKVPTGVVFPDNTGGEKFVQVEFHGYKTARV